MSVIEINRESYIDPKNTLKIDGVEIKGIQNVKIEYGLDHKEPVVIIQVAAERIIGKIKANKIKIKETPSDEMKKAWDKIKPKKVSKKLKLREYLGVLFR